MSFNITKEEKKGILEELKKDIKKEIVICELNVRYLEREKLSTSEANLIKLEENLKHWDLTRKGLEKKLEVANDEFTGK